MITRELEPLDDASCRWHRPEDTWLVFRLALLGCDVTIHEPTELVENTCVDSTAAAPAPWLPEPRRQPHPEPTVQ
ncbi:hypothetical protein V6V47_23075 [Micromonospora sp. CPCC 205539]|uniref:hypothetical protein n=1 Tax=Micromonospora sp. CPCC 205539 TaxID=3122408 RepID=UPI002FEF5E85